jgi:AcrR family transcriptional regulator
MATTKRTRLTAEVRREQLVTTAAALISRYGYNGFSLTALAEACGISRGGVLFHFESKEQLLLEVLDSRDSEDIAAASAAFASWDDVIDFRSALDIIVQRNFRQREFVRLYAVLNAEALDPSHPAHDYFQRRQAKALADLAPVLTGLDRDPREVAIEVLAFLDGLQLAWLRDPTIDLVGQWSSFADRLFASGERRSPVPIRVSDHPLSHPAS